MAEDMYPAATPEIAARRKELAPEINEAFEHFSRAVFADGALPEKTKQLIAVAVAHVTQCPYCITGHTKLAHRKGAHPNRGCRSWGLKPPVSSRLRAM
ncbi:carboxymuconolactone decarboxylase family protein [Pseudonocardia saturnea]